MCGHLERPSTGVNSNEGLRVRAGQGCGVAGWVTRVGIVLQQYTRRRDKAGIYISAVTATTVIVGRWGVGEESGARPKG